MIHCPFSPLFMIRSMYAKNNHITLCHLMFFYFHSYLVCYGKCQLNKDWQKIKYTYISYFTHIKFRVFHSTTRNYACKA